MEAKKSMSVAVIDSFDRSSVMFDLQSKIRRTQASLDLLLQFCQQRCDECRADLESMCDRVQSEVRVTVVELANKYFNDEIPEEQA